MFGIIKFFDVGGDVGSGASAGSAIGSIVPGVGTLVGGAVGGLIGLGVGLFGHKKANNILNNNPRPVEPIPQAELANQQIAQNVANEGTPSAQYEAAKKNIQRQQAAAVAQAQDRRAGVGAIGVIQQGTDDAYGNLDAQSAAARRQGQLGLINVNSRIGAYQDKAWEWNQQQKYIQNFNYGQSLLGQSNQNIVGGVDKVLAAGSRAYSSGLFGNGGNSYNSTTSAPRSYVGGVSSGNMGDGSTTSPASQYSVLNPNASSIQIGQ